MGALAVALQLARQGLAVFPCGADKRPTCKGGFLAATRDEEALRQLWQAGAAPLVGIATGEINGLAVLDVDSANRPAAVAWMQEYGSQLPETWVGSTRSGGQHWFFRHRVGLRCSAGQIAPGIDVRADGGYVIAWPWLGCALLNGAPLAPWPTFLDAILDQMSGRERSATDESREYGDQQAPVGNREALAAIVQRLPNGAVFDAREVWVGFAHALKACFDPGTAERLWLEHAAKREQRDGEPERVWDTLSSPHRAGEWTILEKARVCNLDVGDYRPAVQPRGTMPGAIEDADGIEGKSEGEESAPPPPVPAIPAAWLGQAQRAGNRVLSNLHNVLLCLRQDPRIAGAIGWNAMLKLPYLLRPLPRPFRPLPERARQEPDGTSFRSRPLRDDDVTAVQETLQRWGLREAGKDTVHQAVDLIAKERAFHPVGDWLAGLIWDGMARVDGWLARYLGTENDTEGYHCAIGRMFLVQMVARIFEPGCQADYMLILEGAQGELKSSACKLLAGEWFSDHLPDLRTADKDVAQHLNGKWLIEVGELSAMSRADSGRLKAFVTRTTERYRPSYGRKEVVEPRECVFVGTTNDCGYLRDDTGARRYWPATVGQIDLAGLKADRDQLFAEAVALYRAGEKWWPARDFERRVIEPEQEERRERDEWEEPIGAYLDNLLRQPDPKGRQTTVCAVGQMAIGLSFAKFSTADQRRVAAAMRRCGWSRARRRGFAKIRFWEKI